ncbi:MAG: porin [Pseudomonadota bacterium]
MVTRNSAGARKLITAFTVTGALLGATGAWAGGTIEFGENQSISVGAGMRSAFSSVENAAPGGDDSTDFDVQSMRLYVGGQMHEKVKFTFNTECTGCGGGGRDVSVLDAIVQMEFSPEFNVWLGRMLTPADRIEMNGPYYALSWNQYTVPLLPSDQLGQAGLFGRDDGATVWGTLGKFQYAIGAFDGVEGGPNVDDSVLFSGRVAYNFLNMEGNPAYYTSSTYFGGAGDVFTVGLSFQSQSDGTGTAASPGDFSAVIFDALFEKPLASGDVITIEGEYKSFDADLSLAALASPTCFCLFDGEASFVTAGYMFSQPAGMGKFQPYLRFTSNEPDGTPDSDLFEAGLNYVISGHNLRFNLNYTSGDANITGARGPDVDAFSLGVQIQI